MNDKQLAAVIISGSVSLLLAQGIPFMEDLMFFLMGGVLAHAKWGNRPSESIGDKELLCKESSSDE